MAISADLSNSCAAKTGGASKIWLLNADEITSQTSLLDVWVGIGTSGDAYAFEFELDTAEYRFTSSRENGSIKVEHEVEFFTKGLSDAQRARLQEIAEQNCGIVAIVKDNEGVKWVVGMSVDFTTERPLYMESIAGSTGKEMTDLTGSTVILKSVDNAFAQTTDLSDAAIDAL